MDRGRAAHAGVGRRAPPGLSASTTRPTSTTTSPSSSASWSARTHRGRAKGPRGHASHPDHVGGRSCAAARGRRLGVAARNHRCRSTYAVSSGVSFRCRQGVSFECRLTDGTVSRLAGLPKAPITRARGTRPVGSAHRRCFRGRPEPDVAVGNEGDIRQPRGCPSARCHAVRNGRSRPARPGSCSYRIARVDERSPPQL